MQRANFDDDELQAFRQLAKHYQGLHPEQIDALLNNQDWMEICHEHQAKIQI